MADPSSPPPSPAEPQLSKTQLRKLARQAASDLAAAEQQPTSPARPAMAEDDADERLASVGSACAAVIGRRVKVLSKKAQRHQTYTDIPREQLNPDQLSALDKLDGLTLTIKELEELKKAVEVAELEQAAALRAKKHYEQERVQAHADELALLLALSRAHALLFPPSPSAPGFAPPPLPAALAALTAQEVAGVGAVWWAVVQHGQAAVLGQVRSGDEGEVLEGVRYGRVREILRALPLPEGEQPDAGEQPTIDQPPAERPQGEGEGEYQPFRLGSSSINEERAVPPLSSAPTFATPAAQEAHGDAQPAFAPALDFTQQQQRQQAQMSFGTAVPATPLPAPEARTAAPGQEGEGEPASIAPELRLPAEVARDEGEPTPADADQIAAVLSGTAGQDGRARRARGGRGPRRKPREGDAAPATADAGEGALAPPAGEGEKRRAARSPRPTRSPKDTTPTATAAAAVEGENGPRKEGATTPADGERERRPRGGRGRGGAGNGHGTGGAAAGAATEEGTAPRRAGGRGARGQGGQKRAAAAAATGNAEGSTVAAAVAAAPTQ